MIKMHWLYRKSSSEQLFGVQPWSVFLSKNRVITYHGIKIFRCTSCSSCLDNWAASSQFGTYCLCEQRRFRRACASAQSRQNLCCSLIQAVSLAEPSDRKPDPWPLWMAGHAQLQFVMTKCSKTQICLTGFNYQFNANSRNGQKYPF